MKQSRPYHAFTAYHREPGGLRRLDFFADTIERWRGARTPESLQILDIGCGNGNLSLPLGSLGYHVTGADLDAGSVAHARSMAEDLRLQTVRFVHGDLDAVQDRTYDVIVASEVLEHQKDPHAFIRALRQMLAPGGLLLLSVPNGRSLEERLRKFTTHTRIGRAMKIRIKRMIGGEHVQSGASHPHEQFFSWHGLTDLLADEQFALRESQPAAAWFKEFWYLFGRLFMRRGSKAFHACDGIDGALASALPMGIADGWLLAARVRGASPLVIQIIPTLAAGGAERVVAELASRLPQEGFSAMVIATQTGGPTEDLLRERGVEYRILGGKGPMGISAFFRLRSLLRELRPAAVHTHLFGADVIGRVAARFARVPVVLSTEHNVNLDHGMLKRLLKRVLAQLTTLYVAVSSESKSYMSKADGIPEQKIRVIRNGIDMEHLALRPSQPFHDIPRLICVARLDPQKGHATLFKALALVKVPWVLRLLGTGESEPELRALADRLGIAGRIHWLGYRADVADLLTESDLFCFPSRWEGLGLAFLEAAAVGVPIVASDLSVFHEVLAPTEALYAPIGDVPAFARAIERALLHPSETAARANAAAAHVRTEFTIEKMVGRYARLYRECLRI